MKIQKVNVNEKIEFKRRNVPINPDGARTKPCTIGFRTTKDSWELIDLRARTCNLTKQDYLEKQIFEKEPTFLVELDNAKVLKIIEDELKEVLNKLCKIEKYFKNVELDGELKERRAIGMINYKLDVLLNSLDLDNNATDKDIEETDYITKLDYILKLLENALEN